MFAYRLVDSDYVLLRIGTEPEPELLGIADALRRDGLRVGIASVSSREEALDISEMLHGARAVALVEPHGHAGCLWREELRGRLQQVHPSIPRLYSIIPAATTPQRTFSVDLRLSLRAILQSVAGYGPDVLPVPTA